jgi:hypothetical protein
MRLPRVRTTVQTLTALTAAGTIPVPATIELDRPRVTVEDRHFYWMNPSQYITIVGTLPWRDEGVQLTHSSFPRGRHVGFEGGGR